MLVMLAFPFELIIRGNYGDWSWYMLLGFCLALMLLGFIVGFVVLGCQLLNPYCSNQSLDALCKLGLLGGYGFLLVGLVGYYGYANAGTPNILFALSGWIISVLLVKNRNLKDSEEVDRI